jgi:hypothetical protein
LGFKVTNMRHSVGAIAKACLTAAVIAAAGTLIAATSETALAYSGSQAEAQSDPYAFPNIDLCCEKKKPAHRPKRRHNGGHGHPHPNPDNGDYDHGYSRNAVRVSCGAPQPYSYSSIREALEHVREGGRIRVRPGAACDISGLVIDEGILIETDDYAYGARAQLVGRDCASVAPGYGHSTVTFRGVDIDGCLIVNQGRLAFHEVNLASRGTGDAVRLNGGSFTSTDSTVRARGTAVNAVNGGMVSITGGGFASGARAETVVALNVDGANVANTMIKGGLVGVRVGMTGRSPVTFSRVQVLRGEANEMYQIGPGQAGILVGGPGPGDDLPSLPSLPGTAFTIEGGAIAGFGDGLVFAPGTRGAAKGVNIAHVGRGIVVAAAASVDLRENRMTRIKRTGIDLESGATGVASFNDIQCDNGSCVCYGGDCTSRSDRDFGRGAFRMSGTRCDD